MTAATRPERLHAALLDRAAAARDGASFCPAEVARTLADDWRPGPLRAAAVRLAGAGALVASQAGLPVDPRTARGPIRLRRP